MHYTCKYLICSIIWILCCMQQYCVSQSTTVRPYKFGFTIDQQQHRSEKRDERGIVMGEFGFITADGIYHVTVYATDEQGRFRILAMKNYPYESPPKTVEVMVQPKIPVTTTTTRKPLPKHNFNTEACSGCFLTNGNNKPKGLDGAAGKTGKNDIRPLSKPLPNAASAPAGPNSSNKPSSGNKFVAQKENDFLHSNQKDTNLNALVAQSLAMRELVQQTNIAKKVQYSTPSTPATSALFTAAATKTKDTKEYKNISQNPLNKQKINNNSHTHTNAQKTNTLFAPKAPQISPHNVPSVQHLHSVNTGLASTTNGFAIHPASAPTLSQSILQQHAFQNAPSAQRQHSVNSGVFTTHPANTPLNTATQSPSVFQKYTTQKVPSAQHLHSVNSGVGGIANAFTPHPANTPLNTATQSPSVFQQYTTQNVPSVQHLHTVHSGVPSAINAFTRQPANAPLNTVTHSPSSLQQHTFPTNSIQNIPTKSTAFGSNTQNTALANSPRPAQDTQDFPLKSSTQTQNTNSASSSSNKPFGGSKSETPTNTLNTASKGSNQQTSQPKPGATAGPKPPPIMDIIMQKVLPALMGSKSSTPTTLSNKPNAGPSSKIPGSSSVNGVNRKTGSSGNGDGDLYRFKYILDYHGHSETGKRNGNKEGNYFAIGDDNVERTIEYVANEFGYQPRIRWRKLNDNEIKSKENTLKDYEFIWFN